MSLPNVVLTLGRLLLNKMAVVWGLGVASTTCAWSVVGATSLAGVPIRTASLEVLELK